MAPVATTANISNKYIVEAAGKIKLIELALVHELHYYNWFAPMPMAVGGIDAFCGMLPDLCKTVGQMIWNGAGVDNPARFDVFMSNEPSGSSYRTFVYHAQMINSGKFNRYDYGPIKNKQVYGQADVPLVLIEKYNIPTVLLSGDIDGLATSSDVAWLSQILGDKVVF